MSHDDDAQGELLPIEHVSLQPGRLRSGKQPWNFVNAEALYLREWRRELREHPTLLDAILAPDDAPRGFDGRITRRYASRRDAIVAATLIQWLATNVGSAFIERCKKTFETAAALRLEVGVRRANARGALKLDQRTPLERRKARLDAARKRLKEAK